MRELQALFHSTPALVTNKLSPMQQHLAAQKNRDKQRLLRSEEPIVKLTATRSPTKQLLLSPRDSDSDVICITSDREKGWLSTPSVSTTKKMGVPSRKTKSLPTGSITSPNQLISSYFKPISNRPSNASGSEVEVLPLNPLTSKSLKDASKDTSAKDTSRDTSNLPTRSPSPIKTPGSPMKKQTTPFKAIRMCPSSITKTKIVKPLLKLEFSSDAGTEGPLSDIDDILTGSIPNLESHPLADSVFHPSNPHLKDVMERICGDGEEIEEDAVDAEALPEKKKKERKKVERKPKSENRDMRKGLVSGARRPRSDSDTSGHTTRKKVPVRKPLSARQIYHGRNWVPLQPEQEEEECQCDWVMDYTRKKLEDIVDLNSAEKIMMNLWNKHVNKYQGRGIMHMDKVVMDFLTERSHTIVELNLYRNFVIHLSGLHQANIISSETFFGCVNNMQDVMKVLDETDTVVGPAWKHQRDITITAARRSKGDTAPSPTRMLRCSGRGRPNSSLSSPPSVCRSPARPGAASPSRPTSIGRGRRSSNWSKNAQKSLDFDVSKHNPVEVLQATNESTPGKPRPRPGPSHEARSHWSNSAGEESGDTEASEGGQEVASFLTSLEGVIRTEPDSTEAREPGAAGPQADKAEQEYIVHVLTEEPDTDQEGEEEAMEDEQEETEEVEVAEGAKKHTKKEAAVKDFIKLQAEEYERIKELAKDKKVDSNRVLVLSISDSMVEHIQDRLAKQSTKLQALKNLYKKTKKQKRKKSIQLSEVPYKKTKKQKRKKSIQL